MNKKFLLVLAPILVLAATWFYLEDALVYWKTNSPLPKRWISVQLQNGEILYGKPAGLTSGIFGMREVHRLESFSPVAPVLGGSISDNFTISGINKEGAINYKLVPVPAADTLFINRNSVVYWKYLDENDPLGAYLK